MMTEYWTKIETVQITSNFVPFHKQNTICDNGLARTYKIEMQKRFYLMQMVTSLKPDAVDQAGTFCIFADIRTN